MIACVPLGLLLMWPLQQVLRVNDFVSFFFPQHWPIAKFLRSRNCYVIYDAQASKVYLWKGCKITEAQRKVSHTAVRLLKHRYMYPSIIKYSLTHNFIVFAISMFITYRVCTCTCTYIVAIAIIHTYTMIISICSVHVCIFDTLPLSTAG